MRPSIAMICACLLFWGYVFKAEWRWEDVYHLSVPEKAELRAILDMLSFAEGTYTYGDDGYRIIYGGSFFKEFTDHPRIIVCLPYQGKPLCATAAGRYQILQRTFDRLGLPDFSPESQDSAAIKLLAENGIFEIIKKRGHSLKDIVNALNKTWATLPGAPYGQPTKAFNKLNNFYQERINYYLTAQGS